MPTKTAIVTGGSRGIGRGIALALGREGWGVVINYNRNRAAADEAAALVKDVGGEALTVQANIASTDDHARLLDAATSKFGPITSLINNAGVAPKVRADVLTMTEDSYDFVMDTNLKGPYLLSQRVANHMIEAGASADTLKTIVNIGSISAYAASVNRGEYCLSKAGMGMMTALFAARLAEHGINVYEVRPGVIATDMTGAVKAKYDKLILEDERGISPIRRWGRPDDIGKAVAALARGDLPFSTGEVINVDGGFHLKTL
ncbi:MAG: 3-ketoacyl-ACP reductase [Planctomycetes bacterium]|jgi:NAD(P)-dependent dehydrogenase (short-subunit alcohol dehydrogenase family)|nr:3-ketoacyl-ACP reductase [Planctomycetota bacterium]